MRLSADMKWTGSSSTAKLKNRLFNFVCVEETNLKKIFQDTSLPYSGRIEMCVNGGKVNSRSYFVFLKSSRKKSRIIGACSTNRLVDLVEDFDFLKEQMKKLNLTFTLNDPKVFLDNNQLFDNEHKRGISIKSVLPEFLGTIGFVSGATSYLIFGEFNQITAVSFVLGLLFWIGSIFFGSGNHRKYVFIEQE
jgi:hypothetical protein